VELLNLNFVKPVETLIGWHIGHANLRLPSFQEASQFCSSALLLAAADAVVVDDSTSRAAGKNAEDETNDCKSHGDIMNPYLYILLCGFFGALGGSCVTLIMIAMRPNRYSASKRACNTGWLPTGFGCVCPGICCNLYKYDFESVSGKGGVGDCEPKVQIAGPVARSFAGETLFAAHGGGVWAVGAAVLEISSGSGGGVETSP
jgi:hypothetical protein